jgi:prepilin-type N-terminal cleavage/methylation domain-containing protein
MSMAKYQSNNMKKGFTLIEIMVSISIFLVVMTISMGSIISIFDANRKAQTMRTTMGNLNSTVEAMAREMRFGRTYHCVASGSPAIPPTPQNCPSGGEGMSFVGSDNINIGYRKSVHSETGTGNIEKRVGSTGYLPVTAPEIIIEELRFYTLGAIPGDSLQPRVLIIVQGYAGTGANRTDFALQTLVSQRLLDI